MPSFHEINFPLPLSFGASGGPQRHTEIVTLSNGSEQRNAARADSRRRYDAGLGVKSTADMQKIIAFFEARRGQLHGFRFRDPLDHSAVDQDIGTGDGARRDFQLIKTYGDAQGQWQRVITKPVSGSLVISINGEVSAGYTTDDNTGVITFTSSPPSGSRITASFDFDVPVRFETDQLNVSLESFGAGSAVHVPLIEVRPYA